MAKAGGGRSASLFVKEFDKDGKEKCIELKTGICSKGDGYK